MSMDINNIENDFFSDISAFLKKQRIRMKLSRKSRSEGQIDVLDKSCMVRFVVDSLHHELLYDIYIAEYSKHLDEKLLYNFDKLYSLQKLHGGKKLPTFIPDMWVIFDEIDMWAKSVRFGVKQKVLT